MSRFTDGLCDVDDGRLHAAERALKRRTWPISEVDWIDEQETHASGLEPIGLVGKFSELL